MTCTLTTTKLAAAILLLAIFLAIVPVWGLNLPGNTVQAVVYGIPGKLVLSGVPSGYSVYSGEWTVWCADRYTNIAMNQAYSATLYSSYDPNLPSCAKDGKQWDRINYIINHKGVASTTDVQDAIWYFSAPDQPMPTNYNAQALVRDALTNGKGFQPTAGYLTAVVVFISCDVQIVFIEVGAGICVIAQPVVPPPAVPPPSIALPAAPSIPPSISLPTSLPIPVVTGVGVVLAASVGGAVIAKFAGHKTAKPEREEPEEEPIPVPLPLAQ